MTVRWYHGSLHCFLGGFVPVAHPAFVVSKPGWTLLLEQPFVVVGFSWNVAGGAGSGLENWCQCC